MRRVDLSIRGDHDAASRTSLVLTVFIVFFLLGSAGCSHREAKSTTNSTHVFVVSQTSEGTLVTGYRKVIFSEADSAHDAHSRKATEQMVEFPSVLIPSNQEKATIRFDNGSEQQILTAEKFGRDLRITIEEKVLSP